MSNIKIWKKDYLLPQRTFLININHHRISLRTLFFDIKNFHSVLRAIWAPPKTCHPPKWDPPNVSRLTLIFIFYHFCKNGFETIDARQHYKFRTTILAPVTLLSKIFLFLHWIPLDHIYIDNWEQFWPPNPFMSLSNSTLNEDQSAKLDLMWICQRTVKQKKIWNVPLDALMCPLQIINWHWTPIIDHSWFNWMLYPPPIQCQNYSSGHKLETDRPNKKKRPFLITYFYTLINIYG